jgi:hypothetical protein
VFVMLASLVPHVNLVRSFSILSTVHEKI